MKKMVLVLAAALCLLTAASTAHAQYWPSSSYSYHFYPGGGSYNYSVSNGYESLALYQHANYGSASMPYNYGGPYGSWSWNYPHPTYYPAYYSPPTYQYYYVYWWHYRRR